MNTLLASASMTFCRGGDLGEAFVRFGAALCCIRPLSVLHVTEHHAA